MSAPRYAIYFAPEPDEPLWQFGSAVLGYDAATGASVAPLVPSGVAPALWAELTAEPRRYGFHATIKAPFRLAEGQDEAALIAALRVFAAGSPAFAFETAIRSLGGFVAIVPAGEAPAIFALERAGVEAFEPFRAPLSDAETARRLKAGLSARQAALLARYGYPYVRDEYRFHMTLTRLLPQPLREPVVTALAAAYDAAVGARRLVVGALCLFRQAAPADPFRIVARVPLGRGEPK